MLSQLTQGLLSALVFIAVFVAPGPDLWRSAAIAAPVEQVLIGRITHIDGPAVRFVPEAKDWVKAIVDTPFGPGDALYSDVGAKVEICLQNGVWIRAGGATQIHFVASREDITAIDVASGSARVHNDSARAVIRATTAFGTVVAPPECSFDLYVGDDYMEVVPLRGEMEFLNSHTLFRYQIFAGLASIVADGENTWEGKGEKSAEIDAWDTERNEFWTAKAESWGASAKYLPESLLIDSHILDEYGVWERVFYEGEYRRFWRPTKVGDRWAPFTEGRWTVYHSDNCWVPNEPFGYTTHHYGDWIHIGNKVFWAPPGSQDSPSALIDEAWYPGRVLWISSGNEIGWIPLAALEPYFVRNAWGPRSIVVERAEDVNVKLERYRFADHAVVIGRDKLYRTKSYAGLLLPDKDRFAVISGFSGLPLFNGETEQKDGAVLDRFAFTDSKPEKKPHETALARVLLALEASKQSSALNAVTLGREVAGTKQGIVDQAVVNVTLKITNRMVAPEDVAKPIGEIRFDQRDLKIAPQTVQATAEPQPPAPPPVSAKEVVRH